MTLRSRAWFLIAQAVGMVAGCGTPEPGANPSGDGGEFDAPGLDAADGSVTPDATDGSACARDCRGTACTAGLCEAVTLFEPGSAILGATFLAVGAELVVWSDVGKIIRRMSRDGGPVTTIGNEGDYASGLTFSEGAFFWSRPNTGDVRVLDASASSAATLTALAGGPRDLAAIDGDPDLYVVTRDSAEVVRVPRAGGAPEVVASAQTDLRFIAGNGAWLVWTQSPLVGPQGSVTKFERATGTLSTIATDLPGPVTITVAGAFAYWANGETVAGSLMRAPLAGGPLEAVASMAGVQFVTSDGDHVYWTSEDSIWRVPVAGGGPELLATGQQDPIGIVADDLWVYWIDTASGAILKVAK